MAMTGNGIRELREARGELRRDLAVICDVSEFTISRWERGTDPPTAQLRALADHFGVSTDEVLGRTAEVAV